MDNLTHSLFGLTLARTPLGRAGRGATTALLLASNAPDVDIVVTAGGAANYLEFHRGPTHGPLGVVGLALAVASLVWLGRTLWDRTPTERPATFPKLCAVSALGVACHILMDLPTSYGTRPFSPFTWTWFAVDWMPIVDIYLLAILAGGLWLGRRRGMAIGNSGFRQRLAIIALTLMAANYGLRATAHHEAVARAPQLFGNRLPDWCSQGIRPGWGVDHWPRAGTETPRDAAAPRCLMELAAVPTFTSPFSWRVIAQLSNGYEVRDLSLVRRGADSDEQPSPERRLSVHIPNQWTPAVATAAASPIAQVFLGFSRFPAARSVIAADGSAVVRWSDVRFIQGSLDDPSQFRRGLFGATVLLGADGRVLEDRLGP